MAQRHLDRLSALDASFLHQEGPESHMHIGALVRCEGPPPTVEELLAHIERRLAFVPRYRQRLAHTPFDRGRPVWVDDAHFRLDSHIHRTALPAPAGSDQLRELVAHVFSTPLDRARPLWELWCVEGLADGGFALIFKTHHAIVDGVAGVDLATVVFDLEPSPAIDPEEPSMSWHPAPNPGVAELLAVGAASGLRGSLALARRALEATRRPAVAVSGAREAAAGVGEVLWEALHPAPATPLNVEIGPHRRFATSACGLSDLKHIRDALGGTVNDVVLAVVTGALRRFLISRGVATDGLVLYALVPVSVRTAGEGGQVGQLGNRLAAMRAPLPVGIDDPLERFDAVRAGMDAAKGSPQALGAGVLAAVAELAPPALLAALSRLNFTTRLFNLLVTNVPGPQIPLYVLGRRTREIHPIALLPRRHALSVAVLSYDGRVNFGLLGDLDALAELDELAEWIEVEVAELVNRVPA